MTNIPRSVIIKEQSVWLTTFDVGVLKDVRQEPCGLLGDNHSCKLQGLSVVGPFIRSGTTSGGI